MNFEECAKMQLIYKGIPQDLGGNLIDFDRSSKGLNVRI